MGVPYQPDKPAYVPTKSPSARGGRGMGLGAIVFLVILAGCFIVALYMLPPLMEEVDFPDIGIPYPILFLIFIGFAIIVSIYGLIRGGQLVNKPKSRYKERDPSICSRVIKDGYDGEEFIVTGSKEDTFADACKANWQFVSTSLKSKWFVKDEKGNDVTERTLETAEGIFYLIPEYGSETSKGEPDESDKYASIHDSVTYYD